MPEDILLRFANEEIIYLLRSLQITSFPGMSPEPLKPLTDEEKALLMMEADHTLRARGMVRWRGETKREIAPLLTNLLRDCAQPRYTLFVDLLDASTGAAKLLYIFGQEMIVEQCEAEPQVQQYLLIPSMAAFTQRLQRLLVPAQVEEAEALPTGQLRVDLWQEALKAAREDETSAASLLASSLPRPTAEALAHALHAFQRVCYLGLWKQTPANEQDHPDAALTVVVGHEQLFLLWQEEPGSPSFTVISASAEQVKERMARLIPLL